ncbi:hypothetical protein [Vibrio coralliilyticus]|uniref:hypothetical protein n=1 Tax=Vibrio coralliilyticus TaxID=190893 RepID=UPI000BAAF543|nr:hypothetical protein [Vibrio coralliilyticus]NOI60506.1 hypothetical protein [Vibrio coralliilyticus]PAT67301.1 hypothetical protein CKA27_15775 [Vibrio coralliilyticus]
MNILFEQPEIKEFYDTHYNMLMGESDRGCILLGVSIIDQQLDLLFQKIIPEETSKTRRKKIFDGKGAFGNIASKLDIAYVCRILPLDLVDSIKELRKTRNQLAHQTSPFVIRDNLEFIYHVLKKLDIKGCAATALSEMSLQIVRHDFTEKLLQIDNPCPDKSGEKLFSSVEEIAEYVSQEPDVADKLTEVRIRTLFVLCVLLLNALIVFHRNQALERFTSKPDA